MGGGEQADISLGLVPTPSSLSELTLGVQSIVLTPALQASDPPSADPARSSRRHRDVCDSEKETERARERGRERERAKPKENGRKRESIALLLERLALHTLIVKRSYEIRPPYSTAACQPNKNSFKHVLHDRSSGIPLSEA